MTSHPLAEIPAGSDILGVGDVANLVGIDRTTVWSHLKRGTIPEPTWYVSGRPLWHRKTIVAWMISRKRRGRPKS